MPETAAPSAIAYEQEIRLAVVMYGGVSLAIYINGIAQELLRLVRATAPREPGSAEPLFADHELGPVERLYRELGCLLAPRNAKGIVEPAAGAIRTRFVVDVISGTSAGGINGIFLACALARHQDMQQLKNLWVTEGELEKLLNDAASVGDLEGRVGVPNPPKSLLNSQRMYIKLLEALQGMHDSGGLRERGQSALVDELDLFVTATDLKGLVVKLRLADQIAYERRYRNVFRFVHATEHGTGSVRNDFRRGNNPFLAFAARCTSSFPAAFEPMTLQQATDLMGTVGNDPEVREAMKDWPQFYRDYRNPDEVPGREQDPMIGEFSARPFGDGGYLDNKPFGYALSALRQRRADLPMKRKLFYVEPSPQHPELDVEHYQPPDALENLLLAGSTLPRAETIREDLERMLERNRQIEYVARAVRYVGQDFRLPYDDPGKDHKENKWGSRWLRDIMRERPGPNLPMYGGAYGAYHRLKVSEVTSEMAEVIARVVGLSLESDEVTAVRFLMSAWRQYHFLPNPDPKNPQARPENAFLMAFDLSYRLRRLRFVLDRLQIFVSEPARAEEILKITEESRQGDEAPGAAPAPPAPERPGLWEGVPEGEARRALESLRQVRRSLAQVLVDLRKSGRGLRRPSEESALLETIGRLEIGWDDLKRILRAPTPGAKIKVAREVLGIRENGAPPAIRPERLAKVDEVANSIAVRLREAFDQASARVEEILHPEKEEGIPRDPFRRVRLCLWHQYRRFDYFDMMLFPMLAGTDLGEMQPVEILRMSPEDATRLIDERDPQTHRLKRPKLAGTRLGNFGAFLDATWRRSDILWGRLDGAERIVCGLAPSAAIPGEAETAKEAARILARLQSEIVREELLPLGPTEGRKVFVEALLHTRDRAPDYAALTRLMTLILGSTDDPRLIEMLDPARVRDVYTERMRANIALDREKQLRLVARGTQVFGRLLDGLSDRYALIQRRLMWWLVTTGRLLHGLVEIAVPRTVWELFGIYWLNLLYGLEAVLVIGGQLVPGGHGARNVGLILLGVTYVADLGRRLLRMYITSRAWWTAGWILGAAAVGVFLLGSWRLGELAATGMRLLDADSRPWWWSLVGVGLFLGFVAFSRRLDEVLDQRAARARPAAERELEECREDLRREMDRR